MPRRRPAFKRHKSEHNPNSLAEDDSEKGAVSSDNKVSDSSDPSDEGHDQVLAHKMAYVPSSSSSHAPAPSTVDVKHSTHTRPDSSSSSLPRRSSTSGSSTSSGTSILTSGADSSSQRPRSSTMPSDPEPLPVISMPKHPYVPVESSPLAKYAPIIFKPIGRDDDALAEEVLEDFRRNTRDRRNSRRDGASTSAPTTPSTAMSGQTTLFGSGSPGPPVMPPAPARSSRPTVLSRPGERKGDPSGSVSRRASTVCSDTAPPQTSTALPSSASTPILGPVHWRNRPSDAHDHSLGLTLGPIRPESYPSGPGRSGLTCSLRVGPPISSARDEPFPAPRQPLPRRDETGETPLMTPPGSPPSVMSVANILNEERSPLSSSESRRRRRAY